MRDFVKGHAPKCLISAYLQKTYLNEPVKTFAKWKLKGKH